MPYLLIAGVLLFLLAFRYPLINQLAGWLLVFPIVTVSAGTIAWTILIQRWHELFSVQGYGTTLAVFAVLAALWVMRLNGT